ncbi:MAG: Tuberous sclerosis 2-like protein [Vezdaea aestivalis]|nr:MAG: Tuberous sclerosis 2-like protein [Vezdaea aestivalis]
MSPPSENPPQTPESRSNSALANVFRGLTASRRHAPPVQPVNNTISIASLSPPNQYATSLPGSLGRRGSRANFSTISGLTPPSPEPNSYINSAHLIHLIQRIQKDKPTTERTAAAEALRHDIADCSPNSIVEIWASSKDLIESQHPTNTRKAGYDLLEACLKYSSNAPLERRQFFHTLSRKLHDEDFHLQLSLMRDLTKRGKDMQAFEAMIVPLVTSWLKTWTRAAKNARKSSKPGAAALGEETNLASLFTFLIDIVRFNFKTFSEPDIKNLLNDLVSTCSQTTSETDIRNSINVIDAIITYGYLPQGSLMPCVETLCRIYSTLKTLADPTWRALGDLCRSHVAQTTLKALFDLLKRPDTGGATSTARGALAILERLALAKGITGLVKVPVPTLMECMQKALVAGAPRLDQDMVRTIKAVLCDPKLAAMIVEEDCTNMLLVLQKCSERVDALVAGNDRYAHYEKKERDVGSMSQLLDEVFGIIETMFPRFEMTEKERIMTFFFKVHERLSDSCAHLLVDYYIEEHYCYPSNANWLENSNQLVKYFLKNRERQTSVRLLVLRSMREVYETIKDVSEQSEVDGLIWTILDKIHVERDAQVLEMLVNFAVEVADDASVDLFDKIFSSLQRCLPLESGASPWENGYSNSRPSSSATLSNISTNSSSLENIATRAIIHIFMRAFTESAYKASKAFDSVMQIARTEACATDARLSAMKLLFRLRCDSNGAIIIVSQLDSDGLAAALNRTTDTFSAMKDIPEELPPSRHSRLDDNASVRSSRSTSMGNTQSYISRSTTRSTSAWGGTAKVTKSFAPLWIYPDENALPQDAPTAASRLIYAFDLRPPELSVDDSEQPRTTLSFNVWLEVLIHILQNACDWEIYSHVLVHLGSQLTNHRLFQTSIPQIKFLRSVLCEQLKGNSFHEPPQASGLRKADVALCLLHTLTMNMSYYKHFSSGEQDDIVRVFSHGLTNWERTPKRCIHALTICCHELTSSVSKSMTTILVQMGKIITQAHLAVHVLEFLAGLARMSKIYVNFREDDYRVVFGICFRYLQYARDQKQKGSNSGPSSVRTSYASGRQGATSRDSNLIAEGRQQQLPATADDLPQYVYSLAYHVITFWFMSTKLLDRAGKVHWIMRNLISMDANGKEIIDEQSQVTIDMMQRIAYSDFDESVYNPNFASPADGNVRKKSWLDGFSIVTVETAAATGLSQITKRQPSGTSYSIFRLERAPLPQHQVSSESDTFLNPSDESSRIAVLPSHIFLQMSASSFRMPEMLRPIVLPEDDATARELRAFDRNSTVDGHKIGIIYVGENQTTEQEILSNVMGSNDYTNFLSQMGSLTKLKGAKFNTQGLDREFDSDGQFTYCWRDRVTEIVFHITTMMPTNVERDAYCTNKKRHTGNDFVNIIFNNSGQPFRFDTFPSEFNYVNIVVTPESRVSFVATRTRSEGKDSRVPFYKVQVMSKAGFPEVSPAAEIKIISGDSLPAFVRLIALNASVFSQVWSTRDGGENVSSWRNRFRSIQRLRERYAATAHGSNTPTNTSSGSGGGGGGGGSLHGSRDSALHQNRDSSSLRRVSTATFMTDSHGSHRSSMHSTMTETDTMTSGDSDSVVDGYVICF